MWPPNRNVLYVDPAGLLSCVVCRPSLKPPPPWSYHLHRLLTWSGPSRPRGERPNVRQTDGPHPHANVAPIDTPEKEMVYLPQGAHNDLWRIGAW
ncbi:unnamed protein product [Cutaneotrichosporon oleaginosum]